MGNRGKNETMEESNVLTQKPLQQSKLPLYCKSIDWDGFFAENPPPDVWCEHVFLKWSRDQIQAYQERRFLAIMELGWKNKFYRRFWGEAGIEPGDIRGLADLEKLPIFSSEDVKKSIEDHPPFGEVCGIDDPLAYMSQVPLKLQTSGGTTGAPRPTLFGPTDWELNGLTTARHIYVQGGRPGDVLQATATLSFANFGWAYYQAAHHYLGMLPVTTGSGVVTPTRKQLEYAIALGTNIWASFPEYFTQLAKVAETELGRNVRDFKTKMLLSYLGPDLDNSLRRHLEELWGCPVYDNYGTHETNSCAFEGKEQDGLYIMEDLAIMEFLDPESMKPVPTGQAGDIVFTHLHRRIPPLIRYNLRDLGRIKHEGKSPSGSNFRRMDKFLGRSDQMVKIRGVNIYPMACLSAVRSDERTTGEWICIPQRVEQGGVLREEMIVKVEVRGNAGSWDGLQEHLERRFKEDLGIKTPVVLVPEGQLPETNVGKEGKPRRLLDLRGTVIQR